MPIDNPFITRDEWQKDKKKYGVPDKVVKYSFGEKMEALKKKFDKDGFANMTVPQIPAALALVQEGERLIDEYLKALKALAPGKVTNKTAAVDRLNFYKNCIHGLVDRTKGIRDPYLGARNNYQECFALMQKALQHPDDPAALEKLYSNGMRNHLGQSFHGEFKANRATGELRNLLQQYEDLMAEWHDMQDDDGPGNVAGDPARRKQFMSDMTEGMRIAVRILALTKPK